MKAEMKQLMWEIADVAVSKKKRFIP